jgi:putative transposase
VGRLGRSWGRAKLPKLGWVTFRWSRPLGGDIRFCDRRKGGHWVVLFLADGKAPTPEQHAMADTGRKGATGA